jgi:iron complex outermembrane receptor protein
MKAGYSFAYIRNYLAVNSQFAEYTPSGSNPVDASQRYRDYVINLEGMQRHGIELDLNGNVIPSVNVYLSYAYQKYINQGKEPAGDQEAGDRARHRLNAGVRYTFLKDFMFIADYSFQSEQVAVVIEETGTDVNGNPIYSYDRNPMSAYQLVDLALSYRLIDSRFGIRNASFKVFVNNVFSEIYESTAGYPMTDRTFGCALNVKI